MSYLLFLDESGIDQRYSPYEVLAGVAVQDQHLWNLICRIEEAEVEFFGQRVSSGALELKGRSLLKHKTFRLAAQLPPIEPGERQGLARSCLEKGLKVKGKQGSSEATRSELTALAQAKIAWGIRFGAMNEPHREELDSLGELVCELRYQTKRVDQPDYPIWSFKLIEDLRPREERENRG